MAWQSGLLATTGPDGIVRHGVQPRTATTSPLIVVDSGATFGDSRLAARAAHQDRGMSGAGSCTTDATIAPGTGGAHVRRTAAAIRIDLVCVARRQRHLGMSVIASSKDAAMRQMDVECWEKVVRSCPMVALWIDAEPIAASVMAKIRRRTLCGRRHAGCHRCRGAGRRVGAPALRRARHVDRDSALRCAIDTDYRSTIPRR